MACMCRICNSNEVDNPGDVCELCAIGLDPYASKLGNTNLHQSNTRSSAAFSPATGTSYTPRRTGNRKVLLGGGASLTNTDPYGNDMTAVHNEPPVATNPQVQVYGAGQTIPQTVSQAPAAPVQPQSTGRKPTTSGITKNITLDNAKKSVLEKWFRSLIKSVPYTLDDDVTMFQVFPDYSGTALNAQGNACDQVIVYGRLNNGEVSDNNEVEVFGRRDSHNNIIAKTIKNKASGAVVKPQRVIPLLFIWLATLIVLMALTLLILAMGSIGLVWSIVLILCLTNLPGVVKLIATIIGLVFTIIKGVFGAFNGIFSFFNGLFK